MTGMYSKITWEEKENVTIVKFVEKFLDEHNIDEVGKSLIHLIGLGKRKFMLNFSNVHEFAWVAVLAKLLFFRRHLVEVAGELVLCNVNQKFKEMCVMVNLDVIVFIVADEKQGLELFKVSHSA